MRAMFRVSVELLMIILSGKRLGTFGVASEAWKLFWSRSRLAYAASMLESMSRVMKTMQHWNTYQGSSLSIALGEISSREWVCMQYVVGRLVFELDCWCSGLVVVTYSMDDCPNAL